MKIVINDGIVIRVKIATAKNEDEEDVLFQDPHELRKSLLVEMVSFPSEGLGGFPSEGLKIKMFFKMKAMKNVKNDEGNVVKERNANEPNELRTAKKKILKMSDEEDEEQNQNRDPLEAILIL